MDVTPDIEWGSSDDSYGIEDGERPGVGIGLFAKALSVWCYCNPEAFDVITASRAFNCSVRSIKEAVNYDSYMYLDGSKIEFDGE